MARVIIERWSPRPVVVLGGPGSNGGDADLVFLARELLPESWPIQYGYAVKRRAK